MTLQTDLISLFGDMPDPRIDRKKLHKLGDIIAIAILSVICGAESWVDMALFGASRYDWLSKFLDLSNGIPSHDTFRRVFSLIEPEEFEARFVIWTQSLSDKLESQVVIDGKVLKHSGNRSKGKEPIWIVSAWSSDLDLVLSHTSVEEKSNEITAIPKILELLSIKGCIVSIDAMGCQKSIAKEIVDRKGDYVLALKGNQGKFYDEVVNFFDQAQRVDFEGVNYDCHKSYEENRGREEERLLYVTNDLDWLPMKDDWKGLKSIVCLCSERVVKGKKTQEKRYYISSLEPSAQKHVRAIRNHWGIENKQHWILDVGFHEDDCKIQDKIAGKNFATLRRLALNLLKKEKSIKNGIKGKRLRAGWDESYLAKIIS